MIVFFRILLGIIFIASGILKLYPIEPFVYTFVEQGFANWGFAPFIARGIIAIEIFLGLLLVFNFQIKAALGGIIAVLVLFTIYLLIGIFKDGNNGSCGCFGTILEMTPVQSVYKNIALAFLAAILFKYTKKTKPKYKWLVWLIGIFSVSLPLILNPPDLSDGITGEPMVNNKIDLSLLPFINENGQSVNYGQGKKILVFLSVNCPHCKHAAYKLSILKKQIGLPPVYFFFIGNEARVNDFFVASKSNFSHAMFQHNDFFKYSGPDIPAILLIKDGYLIKHLDGKTLSEAEISLFHKSNQQEH